MSKALDQMYEFDEREAAVYTDDQITDEED